MNQREHTEHADVEVVDSVGAAEGSADNVLHRLLAKPAARAHDAVTSGVASVTSMASGVGGVVVGKLLAISGGAPIVGYAIGERDASARAQSIVELRAEHVGHSVVLAFDANGRPIVLGAIVDASSASSDSSPAAPAESVEVDADGERLVVSAREQLVLRCGAASITLTSAGKVIIDGSYVLSRSSGTNRIKGGSIQLN